MDTTAAAAFLAANPDDPIPGELTAPEAEALTLDPLAEAEALPDDFEQISREDFRAQMQMLHHVGGAMLSARLGAPCPLGEASEGQQGVQAIDAIYNLAERNERLRRLVLSAKAGVWGDVLAVAMHGFTCVQIVRAAIAASPSHGQQFASVRAA